jgi:hypothetical protein
MVRNILTRDIDHGIESDAFDKMSRSKSLLFDIGFPYKVLKWVKIV